MAEIGRVQVGIAVGLVVGLIFTMPTPVGAETRAVTETSTIQWHYGMGTWYVELSVPTADYERYRAVPVSDRIAGGIEGYGALITTDDPTLRALAADLSNWSKSEGYSMFDEVSGVLAMIQQMDYTADNVSTAYDEYPKYPLETLAEDGGDCEDTSILLATLLTLMDYEIVLLYFPLTEEHTAHMSLGIAGELHASVPYYTAHGKQYYYCETTGDGFKIGDIPTVYRDTTPQIVQPADGGSTNNGDATNDESATTNTAGFEAMLATGACIVVVVLLAKRRQNDV